MTRLVLSSSAITTAMREIREPYRHEMTRNQALHSSPLLAFESKQNNAPTTRRMSAFFVAVFLDQQTPLRNLTYGDS